MTTGLAPASLEYLLAVLEEILVAHPQGVSEHGLFRLLAKRGEVAFAPLVFTDKLSLFESHFILFHALHTLRGRLWANGRGDLRIGCLEIALGPYAEPATNLPATGDPLSEFYLDLDNLNRTTREDVEAMLADFWASYEIQDGRRDALRVLGLEDPVDDRVIKRRYHDLAMAHHSDRGGDDMVLREINAAMTVLKRGARS